MAVYRASYAGIGEMLRSAEMQAAMHERAEVVMDLAVAISPESDDPRYGHYVDDFHVTSGVQAHETARAYGQVENTNRVAHWVEYGTDHDEAQHILLNALGAAG